LTSIFSSGTAILLHDWAWS